MRQHHPTPDKSCPMTSPREILGLDESATKEDARLAWRSHVRDLHPDLHGGDPEKADALA